MEGTEARERTNSPFSPSPVLRELIATQKYPPSTAPHVSHTPLALYDNTRYLDAALTHEDAWVQIGTYFKFQPDTSQLPGRPVVVAYLPSKPNRLSVLLGKFLYIVDSIIQHGHYVWGYIKDVSDDFWKNSVAPERSTSWLVAHL